MTTGNPLLDAVISGESTKDLWDTTETQILPHNLIAHKPISQMTIDEVLQHQRNNNFGAAGAIQMIRPTLEGFKKGAGLTGRELYDEAMQRKAFDYLINERPAIRTFLAEKDPEKASKYVRAAGKEMSKIWASVADPDTGKSYYAKNGKDKARVSWDKMQKALWDYKGVQNAPLSKSDKVPLSQPDIVRTELTLPNGQIVKGIPLDKIKTPEQQQKFLDWLNKNSKLNYKYNDLRGAFDKAIGFQAAVENRTARRQAQEQLLQNPRQTEQQAMKALQNKQLGELKSRARSGQIGALIGSAMNDAADWYNNFMSGGRTGEEMTTSDKIKKGLAQLGAGVATRNKVGAILTGVLQLAPAVASAMNAVLGQSSPQTLKDIAQGADKFLQATSTGNALTDIATLGGGVTLGSAGAVAKAGLGKLPKEVLKGNPSADLISKIRAENLGNVINAEKHNLYNFGAGTAGGFAASDLTQRFGDEAYAPLAGLIGGAVAPYVKPYKGAKPNTKSGTTQEIASEIINGGLATEILKGLNDPNFKSYTIEAGTSTPTRESMMTTRRALEERTRRGSDTTHNKDLLENLEQDIATLTGEDLFGGKRLSDYTDTSFQKNVIDRVRAIEEAQDTAFNKKATEEYQGAIKGLYADIPPDLRENILNNIVENRANLERQRLTGEANKVVERVRASRQAARDNWLQTYDRLYNERATPILGAKAQEFRQLNKHLGIREARALAKEWLEQQPDILARIHRSMPSGMRSGRNIPHRLMNDNVAMPSVEPTQEFRDRARVEAENALNTLSEKAKTNDAFLEGENDSTISLSVKHFLHNKLKDPNLTDDTKNALEAWKRLVNNIDDNANKKRRGLPINSVSQYMERFNSFKNGLLENADSPIPGTTRKVEDLTAKAKAVAIMEEFNNAMFRRNGVDDDFTRLLGTEEGQYGTNLKKLYREDKEQQRQEMKAASLDTKIENYIQRISTRLKSGQMTEDDMSHLINHLKQTEPELAKDFVRILYAKRLQPALAKTTTGTRTKPEQLNNLAQQLGGDFGSHGEHPNYATTKAILKLMDLANGDNRASTAYNRAMNNISANDSIYSNIHQNPSSIVNRKGFWDSVIHARSIPSLLSTLYEKVFTRDAALKTDKDILKILNDPENFEKNYVEMMGATPYLSTQLLKMLYNTLGSAIGSNTANPDAERPEYEN